MNKINYEKIDELFRLPIQILNEKGYITLFCCSGHEGDEDSYIYFHPEVDLPNYPINYQYQYPNIIRRSLRASELISNAKEVLKWANNLPINPIEIK